MACPRPKESSRADQEEDLFRVPTDPSDGLLLPALPMVSSCRPPSPDVRPFPERGKKRILEDQGHFSSKPEDPLGLPEMDSEHSKQCENRENESASDGRKSPAIISMGRGSIESLVTHLGTHNAKPATLLPRMDKERYRNYNGVAVQSLTAEFPAVDNSLGFRNRRRLQSVPPLHREKTLFREPHQDTPPQQIVLDGFMLLEATGEPLPYDAQCAKLVSKSITHTEAADFKYFSSLRDLDLSDNFLPNMACFSELPSLKKLNMSVNHMSTLGVMLDSAFNFLEVLNLSFNLLSATALLSKQSPLSRLPCLLELDISGNHLGVLPKVLGSFPSLTRLLLSRNSLESDAIRPLCSLKRLKFVDLASNNISSIPDRVSFPGSFPCLEVLDLSYNLVQTRDSITHLLAVPNLLKIIMAGNPILSNHRTGIKFNTAQESGLNELSEKIVAHETFVQKPQLGFVYAYKTTKLSMCDCKDLDDVANCVIPLISGEKIVAAFQSVEAQIEGYRGSDVGSNEACPVNQAYEDRTFLTGVPVNFVEQEECSIPAQISKDALPWEWSEVSDPTVRIASALGMDPRNLPMFSGRLTNNSARAVHALRFAMLHPLLSAKDTENGSLIKHYMKTTESSAHKRNLRKLNIQEKCEAISATQTPQTQQLKSIENVLSSMKTRLKTVEERLSVELYQHQCLSKNASDADAK